MNKKSTANEFPALIGANIVFENIRDEAFQAVPIPNLAELELELGIPLMVAEYLGRGGAEPVAENEHGRSSVESRLSVANMTPIEVNSRGEPTLFYQANQSGAVFFFPQSASFSAALLGRSGITEVLSASQKENIASLHALFKTIYGHSAPK